MLTIYQKRIRMITSEQNLGYFNRNPKEFLRRFMKVDETRIHYFTPESRERSKQWVKLGKSERTRPKTQQSAGKGISHIEHCTGKKASIVF